MKLWKNIFLCIWCSLITGVLGFAKLLPDIGPKVEFAKEQGGMKLVPKAIKRLADAAIGSLKTFKEGRRPPTMQKGKFDDMGPPPAKSYMTPSSLSYYATGPTAYATPRKTRIKRNRGIKAIVDNLQGKKAGGKQALLYKPKYPAYPDFKVCDFAAFDVANEGKLGKGGFGSVFLARHRETGTPIAVKLTTGESIKKSPKHVENEETIHARLLHPFIARFFCTMADPSTSDVYFAMEYVPGLNLAKKISRDFPIPHSQVQKWMAQILLALEYLHDQCIVYRDMKAENILIDEDGNAKLIDFGLSVWDCSDQLKNVAGTLEYTAPEMAAKKPHGRSIDHYGLGVLLYTIKMGRLPFPFKKSGLEKKAYLEQIATREDLISATNDPVYDDLIRRLADRNPETRWGLSEESRRLIRKHQFFAGFDWTPLEDQVKANRQFRPLAPRNDALFTHTTPFDKLIQA